MLIKLYNSFIYTFTFIRFIYYSYYIGLNITYNLIIITSFYYPFSYLLITFNNNNNNNNI